MMKHILIILALSVFFLGGCKSNSTDNNPNNAMTSARTGSTFIYHNYYIDTLGAKITNDPNTAESFDTVTVLATGISYQGKTNVTNFYNSGPEKGSYFLNYEASGDISLYGEPRVSGVFTLHGGWVTLPLAGLSSSTFVLADTVVKENGKPDHRLYETETDTYIGNDNISVGQETLECIKIQSVFVRDDTQGNFGGHSSDTTIIRIAKKTGYIATIEPSTKVISLKNGYSARRMSVLLSYVLK